MTKSHEASAAATLQALSHHELAVETPSPGCVLITEQEVVLGTTAAVPARPGDPYRVDQGDVFCRVGDGQTLLPLDGFTPRRHYPSRSSYLERSCMQREMYRR
jgi:hypothetical protein